jgi:hypothetical protein
MNVTTKILLEIEVEVSGTYYPGRAETPPAYSHGGLPAEPAGFDDLDITEINGVKVNWKDESTALILSKILEEYTEVIEEALIEALPEEE